MYSVIILYCKMNFYFLQLDWAEKRQLAYLRMEFLKKKPTQYKCILLQPVPK